MGAGAFAAGWVRSNSGGLACLVRERREERGERREESRSRIVCGRRVNN